jgi:hypothetical protein
MVTYLLDEILLATLVRVLCGADDWEAIELSREYLAWPKQFLPYKTGIPHAQTFRKVFRLLKHEVLEQYFASWIASLQESARGVVAVLASIVREKMQSPASIRRLLRTAQRLPWAPGQEGRAIRFSLIC